MKKIKVVKKGASADNKQKTDEKAVKTAEIVLKISDWIEDFYKKRSEGERTLAIFVEEKVSGD